MRIIDFRPEQAEEALLIVRMNLREERAHVSPLPLPDSLPDLLSYALNGLGVAAYEDDRMTGFLCSTPPFANAFGSTRATGVFSPLGANGTVGPDRAKTYALLYQAAGEKWVRAGASSHAVCLFAHQRDAQEQFFRFGFGLRCVDAIRGLEEISASPCDGYDFRELAPGEAPEMLPLEHLLSDSYLDSPFFMKREQIDRDDFLEELERFRPLYFIAVHGGRTVAFLRAEAGGETFVCDTPGYLHIKGAYCLPDHRGRGLSGRLLALLVRRMRTQGYARLGVDFESMNPFGSAFWLRHFHAYAHSLVRRIDEGALPLAAVNG